MSRFYIFRVAGTFNTDLHDEGAAIVPQELIIEEEVAWFKNNISDLPYSI